MRYRSCGACTACCTVLAVASIDKALGERCPHECEGGCGIYAQRPEECRGFSCVWLLAGSTIPKAVRTHLPVLYENERPDKLGAVVYLATDSRFLREKGVMTYLVRLTEKGRSDTVISDVLNRLARTHLVCVLDGDERLFNGPPRLMRLAASFVEEVAREPEARWTPTRT